jgi:nucleotide-binding universal stress UspA family protein
VSYKTIAVHLDSGPRCPARIALAARLAKRFDGRVVGIAPTGVPDVILTMNRAVPDGAELVALSASHLRQRAEATAQAFDVQCKTLGVSCESQVVVDEPVDAMVSHGSCSDLIVVGQTDRCHGADGVAFDFPQQVLLHAGPPLLVVPYAGTFTSVGRHVLIAWKGTREAANALRSAIPLLRMAERVMLIEIGEIRARPAEDDSLALAATWLGSHGIACEAHREIDLAGIADQLLSRAADIGADLIVSGGYGHSRLREWVLGGVTRRLLEHMTVPTLFGH